MDLYAIAEKFDDVPMIRHKFELIVNAMNDQGRKCSTKGEEILFKKSLHLINSQAEAMCKMLKIECCKCQQCLMSKLTRKRVGHHLDETSGNTKNAKSAKKEISKDLPVNNQTRLLQKVSKKSSHVLNDQMTKRDTVVSKRTAVVDNKLEQLREKVKENVVKYRTGTTRVHYSINDLKIVRDYLAQIPNADVALDYFGISLIHLCTLCSRIRKKVDSSFRNPETKKQKDETVIYNYLMKNRLEATMKRYNMTKKHVIQLRNRNTTLIINYATRVLKRLKPSRGSNAMKNVKKKGEKQQQPFNSSMIYSEERKVIFHIFASCDQMNYPLNTCTV